MKGKIISSLRKNCLFCAMSQYEFLSIPWCKIRTAHGNKPEFSFSPRISAAI